MKTKKVLSFFIVLLTLLIPVDLWLGWGNKALVTTEIVVNDERIPSSFSGFRIVQVSDLHNTTFGKENEKLVKTIEKAKPDIIVLTGDMVDMKRRDIDLVLSFVEKIIPLAPVYFVTGNHDVKVLHRERLFEGMEKRGVTVLRNEKVDIEKDGEKITLMGIDDPKFLDDFMKDDDRTNTKNAVESLMSEDDSYAILLAHRAEMFDVFASCGIDLVFSGHAHGGQVRLGSSGGLLAPGQGWFPQYDAGLYEKENTKMIVSRGLGNSSFPFRINNRPEVVVAVLNK